MGTIELKSLKSFLPNFALFLSVISCSICSGQESGDASAVSEELLTKCWITPFNRSGTAELEAHEEICQEAIAYLELAAIDGDGVATRSLGYFYWNTGKSEAKNRGLAVKFFKRSADQGDLRSMGDYADALLHGQYVPRDIEAAVRYAQPAGFEGFVSAQRVLAIGNLELGNVEESIVWREFACMNGWAVYDEAFAKMISGSKLKARKLRHISKRILRAHPYVVDADDHGNVGRCLFNSFGTDLFGVEAS